MLGTWGGLPEVQVGQDRFCTVPAPPCPGLGWCPVPDLLHQGMRGQCWTCPRQHGCTPTACACEQRRFESLTVSMPLPPQPQPPVSPSACMIRPAAVHLADGRMLGTRGIPVARVWTWVPLSRRGFPGSSPPRALGLTDTNSGRKARSDPNWAQPSDTNVAPCPFSFDHITSFHFLRRSNQLSCPPNRTTNNHPHLSRVPASEMGQSPNPPPGNLRVLGCSVPLVWRSRQNAARAASWLAL